MIGDYLLALEEQLAGYVRLYVVGPDGAQTDALFRAALAFDDPTRIVERARPDDSHYPYPGEPAVFACTADACSMPVTDPDALAEAAHAFLGR